MIKAVYKITNNVNGKMYIGKSGNLTRRWEIHLEELFLDKHENYGLQSDFNKFGYSEFRFEIIKTFNADTKNIELLEFETDCIIDYDTLNPNIGYNLSLPIKNERTEQWKTSIKDLEIFNKDKDIINKILDNINVSDIFVIQKVKSMSYKNVIAKNSFTQNWLKKEDNSILTKNSLYNWNRHKRDKKYGDLYITTYATIGKDILGKGLICNYIKTWTSPNEKRNSLAFIMNPNINSFKIKIDDDYLKKYYDVFMLLDWIGRVSDIDKEIDLLVASPYLAEKVMEVKNDRSIVDKIIKNASNNEVA